MGQDPSKEDTMSVHFLSYLENAHASVEHPSKPDASYLPINLIAELKNGGGDERWLGRHRFDFPNPLERARRLLRTLTTISDKRTVSEEDLTDAKTVLTQWAQAYADS